MKYVIKKSVQVKGFTRTRKGKMERVKPYSRAVNKFADNVKKLPTSLLEKLIPSTDPQAKWRDPIVITELERRHEVKSQIMQLYSKAFKMVPHSPRQEKVRDEIKKLYAQLPDEKLIGEPYDTREKEYAQPKEGAIEKIGGKWKIAKKVMVEVKREKREPEIQWTDPTAEDISAIKAKAQQRAETIVAGHQAKREARELEQARREMAGAKTKDGIYEVLKKLGTAMYRKKIVGEPYEVKEHTKEEYKEYLDSLTTDERELELEKWKLKLGLNAVGRYNKQEIGEPYEVDKPLRRIELETKGMKKTKEWKIKEALQENSNTINSPKYLNAKTKKDINGELHDISTKYHTQLPIDEIFGVLEKRGIVVLQEDNTKFSGFFLGENAQTYFPVAPVGSKDNEFYTPFRNSALTLGWYKMPSGKYEVTTYIG